MKPRLLLTIAIIFSFFLSLIAQEIDRAMKDALMVDKFDRSIDGKLLKLSGSDATDCGRASFDQDHSQTDDCVIKSVANKKPFHAKYAGFAIDVYVSVGFAGDKKGHVFQLDSSIDPHAESTDAGQMKVRRCPKPIHFRSEDSELTCLR